MNWINRLFSRRRIYGDLSEEIQEHLAEKVDELVAGGMSREEAAHAAWREFGNATLIEERGREVWQWPSIENIFIDVRYGLRQLRRSPGFTTVAVLTLALGIGANTAIFSVLNALVLRTLPVQDPSRLVQIYTADREHSWAGITVPQIEEIEHLQGVFTGVFGRVYPNNSYVEERGTIWPINLGYVTGQYYSVLGVRPVLGRLISPADVGLSQGTATPVAVLGYELWQRRYAGSRNIVGRTILIAKMPFTIIGVTPKGFFGEQVGFSLDVTIPITEKPGRSGSLQKVLRCQFAIGRLRDGVSLQQARAQLEALWPAIRSHTIPTSPQTEAQGGPVQLRVLPYPENGFSFLRERFSEPLYVLVAIAALILLITCVNLASLLFARAAARQQELSIRIALGAGRCQLMRQLVAESLVLSVCGASAGVGFAYQASGWLVRFWNHIPFNPVTTLDVTPDVRVLGFATGIALLTGNSLWLGARHVRFGPSASKLCARSFARVGQRFQAVRQGAHWCAGGPLARSGHSWRTPGAQL